MPRTIIAHLAEKLGAITADLQALEHEPAQRVADGRVCSAWGDSRLDRQNGLHDALDRLTDDISHRPAVNHKDAAIQMMLAQFCARVAALHAANGAEWTSADAEYCAAWEPKVTAAGEAEREGRRAAALAEIAERLIAYALPAILAAGNVSLEPYGVEWLLPSEAGSQPPAIA